MGEDRKCSNCGGDVKICISCGKEICHTNHVLIKIDAINPDESNPHLNNFKITFPAHLNYSWERCSLFMFELCPDCYKKIKLEEKTISFKQLQKTIAHFINLFRDKEEKE